MVIGVIALRVLVDSASGGVDFEAMLLDKCVTLIAEAYLEPNSSLRRTLPHIPSSNPTPTLDRRT